MSPRPAKFRQVDVTRALRAAKAAGITVSRYEIDTDGKIVVVSGSPDLEFSGETQEMRAERKLAEWDARHGAAE
jgi:hypothetical protein